MCGRYSLALRPSQVRRYLEDEDLPVYDFPEDDADDAPRQSYNFAPGYHGIVYRANVPDTGAGTGSRRNADGEADVGTAGGGEVEEAELEETTSTNTADDTTVRYKLQSMKWGLIPFWTKRNPDYGSMLKTINCRDDSLIDNRGMWTSMKNKKRCIVIAQGFYEWLKKGPKEKVPHFTKRKDGKLMCFAGLWDCVQYEGEEQRHYTYTIITTSSNKQLNFLHDRMPVILETEDIRTWLDPKRSEWTKELQALMKPSQVELEIYPVSKDVGKVGNNSPTFIIPVASTENKSNIANFFAKGSESKVKDKDKKEMFKKEDVKDKEDRKDVSIKHEPDEKRETAEHEGKEDNAPLPVPKEEATKGVKRELGDVPDEDHLKKMQKTIRSPEKTSPTKPVRKGRSATSNKAESPIKSNSSKSSGNRKITNFFSK